MHAVLHAVLPATVGRLCRAKRTSRLRMVCSLNVVALRVILDAAPPAKPRPLPMPSASWSQLSGAPCSGPMGNC